jgi:hypothetical protein
LTENREPDIESVTANNSPREPCTLKIGLDEPEPIRVSCELAELDIVAEPVNAKTVPLMVRFDEAVAAFVVPSDSSTRKLPALFIVLNPVPLVPEVPLVPDVPDVPLLPEEPDVPLLPDEPDVPELPDEPDVPLEPDEPEEPDVPLLPDEPDVPELPEEPDVPLDPEEPDVPDEPEEPDVPDEPEEPEVPDVPDEPAAANQVAPFDR